MLSATFISVPNVSNFIVCQNDFLSARPCSFHLYVKNSAILPCAFKVVAEFEVPFTLYNPVHTFKVADRKVFSPEFDLLTYYRVRKGALSGAPY